MDIEKDRGEFLGFSNLVRNPFLSLEGCGSFVVLASMQP
jgi:hypothetical protein